MYNHQLKTKYSNSQVTWDISFKPPQNNFGLDICFVLLFSCFQIPQDFSDSDSLACFQLFSTFRSLENFDFYWGFSLPLEHFALLLLDLCLFTLPQKPNSAFFCSFSYLKQICQAFSLGIIWLLNYKDSRNKKYLFPRA